MIERAESPVQRNSTFSGGLSGTGIAREPVGIVGEKRVYVEIGQIVPHFGGDVGVPRRSSSGRERIRRDRQTGVMRHAHETRLALEEKFRRCDARCKWCNFGET